MTRRLLNLMTALSLLLCAALLVCWGRSYQAAGTAALTISGSHAGARSGDGVLSVGYGRRPSGAAGDGPVRWAWEGADRRAGPWERLGFAWGTVEVTDGWRAVPVLSKVPALGRLFQVGFPARFVAVPWWLLTGMAAALPAVRLRAACRRRRWRRAGRCAGCGYDLRGTPEGCPECGRAVSM